MLGRRHDDGRRGVGLDATVELAERLADPWRREVVVHRERYPAHQRLLVELRVLAERDRDLAGIGGQDVEQLLITRRDERVELRRAARAVREVEVEQDVGDRAAVEAAPWARHSLARAERGVAVPADDHEHVLGNAGAHCERRVLQRRSGARAAHVHRGRDVKVFDAEVRRQLFARRVARRRDHAVDVGDREAGVGDGRGRGFEHQLDGQTGRAAHIVGLADADDRRAAPDAVHERRIVRDPVEPPPNRRDWRVTGTRDSRHFDFWPRCR